MPSTRSGRINTDSNPARKTNSAPNKRKADAISPSGKNSKSERPAKEQKTLEESFNKGTDDEVEPSNSLENQIESKNGEGVTEKWNGAEQDPVTQKNDTSTGKENGHINEHPSEEEQPEAKKSQQTGDVDMRDSSTEEVGKPGTSKDEVKASEQPSSSNDVARQSQLPASSNDHAEQSRPPASSNDNGKKSQPSAQGDAVQTDPQRKEAMPSNILEKGIIYFFTRGRVGTDEPENVQDLQRSYFVLRPIPQGGKITDGGVQDVGNNRLFALPKKVWPKSGRDRFMVFVEKAKVSMATLKEEFFQGSEYSTQTSGVRHTPPVAPLGEGVYAITSTGGGQGTTHLVYLLTVPEKPGQVQQDVGIADKGSFVLSLKNPESSGPAYASLPEKPDYPKEFIDEFRGRGWMPVAPKHLDYPNAQLLLIGEDFESSKNLEAKPNDEQDDKKRTPEEELQKLEDEDEHRVDSLKGDDTIFVDLGISKKEYSGIMTTCIALRTTLRLHDPTADFDLSSHLPIDREHKTSLPCCTDFPFPQQLRAIYDFNRDKDCVVYDRKGLELEIIANRYRSI